MAHSTAQHAQLSTERVCDLVNCIRLLRCILLMHLTQTDVTYKSTKIGKLSEHGDRQMCL